MDREDGPSANLETLKTWFREAEEALYSSRRASQRDRDYVDGKQWTSEESRALKRRGQSDAVYNRMRMKVDTLVGVEQELRQDPRAYPRSPNAEDDANAATDALRYVADANEFDKLASKVFDQACCVEGAAGVEVIVEAPPPGREAEGPRIVTNVYLFDRVGWDPHSRLEDYSDARYLHTITWMDGEQAKARWPEHAEEIIGPTIAAIPTTQSEVYDDAPRFWADRTRNRIQVVQMWWLEGDDWWFSTFVGGGFLDGPMPSPYMSDTGESECGLLLCSGYISREGERYGAARQWVGPQDDINKRRSKAQHLLSVRQTVADYGVVKDKRAFKREMAKPDGHWDKDGEGELSVLPTGEMATGQLALLQEAKQEIDETGPNSQSTTSGDITTSGVAVQSNQRASMLPLSMLMDNHRDWKLRVYRAWWSRIRQFWRAPKWLRVSDDPHSVRFVGLNMPVTLGEQVAQGMQAQGMQVPPQAMADPRMQLIADVQNEPAKMDVDIVIDESPDVVTTAEQEFKMLVELVQLGMPIPPAAIIRASALRGKDEILDALEGDPEQAQAVAEQQQRQQQITDAMLMANVRKLIADATHKEAQAAQIGAETPAEIEYTEARADKATAEAAKTASEVGQQGLLPSPSTV